MYIGLHKHPGLKLFSKIVIAKKLYALFNRLVCNVKILGNSFVSHFNFIIYTMYL